MGRSLMPTGTRSPRAAFGLLKAGSGEPGRVQELADLLTGLVRDALLRLVAADPVPGPVRPARPAAAGAIGVRLAAAAAVGPAARRARRQAVVVEPAALVVVRRRGRSRADRRGRATKRRHRSGVGVALPEAICTAGR